ncbi:hypothetical protein FHS20_004942 [Phyllobacterium endophyticum]|nr:hypothetical protein [Phyllobacterium endophyticum]
MIFPYQYDPETKKWQHWAKIPNNYLAAGGPGIF